jgi:hypothetical protein
MNEEVFADGIGEISFEHGVFRIDLVSISATKRDKENKPVLEFKQRILMPPDGFLRSFSSMERIIKRLVDAGAIKRAEPQKEAEKTTTDEVKPPSFS